MEAGDDPWSSEAPFDRCRWFWRGWTLQELLAPDHVEFFNCDWQRLGSKRDLSSVISRATGINKRVLRGEVSIDSTSIAQRMSWAAGRKTRRPEDRSYCLMGLFQINMVMLYGEGAVKAFLRLQEEIMRSTSDPTLFAFHGWYRTTTAYLRQAPMLSTTKELVRSCATSAAWEDITPDLASRIGDWRSRLTSNQILRFSRQSRCIWPCSIFRTRSLRRTLWRSGSTNQILGPTNTGA